MKRHMLVHTKLHNAAHLHTQSGDKRSRWPPYSSQAIKTATCPCSAVQYSKCYWRVCVLPADRRQNRVGLHLSIELCCSGWLSSSGSLWLDFLTLSCFPLALASLLCRCHRCFGQIPVCCLDCSWSQLQPNPEDSSHDPLHYLHHFINDIWAQSSSCTLCIKRGSKTAELECSLQEVIGQSHYMLHMLFPSPSTGTSGPCL